MNRILAFGCRHSPFGPTKPWEELLSICEDFKPTKVWNLGDWFEAGAASVHANEYDHAIDDEYEAAARDSREIRAAAPDAELTWLLGNHDDNLQAPDPRRIPKALRRSVHWNRSEWADEFRRWKQVPYVNGPAGVVRCGPVLAAHGWSAADNSDEIEGLGMAYDAQAWHGLSIRSHTHRPIDPTQCWRTNKMPLDWHVANTGTMGPLKPPYMQRSDSRRWGHGVLLIECGRTGWGCELRRINP